MMVQYTKEKSYMTNVMAMEDSFGQMAVTMKDFGNVIELRVKDDLYMQMVMCMTANGKMIKVNK